MKHLAVFILALAIEACAPAQACGPYYPIGDDARFCLLRPDYFERHGMEDFRFSTSFRNDTPMESVKYGEIVNVDWWRKRIASTLPDAVIHEAIYSSEKELKGTRFRNKFLLALMAKGDKAAIDYLRFANRCTPANTFYEDVWERTPSISPSARKQLIGDALKRAKTINDALSRRYAFLAIRMSYYNEDFETLNATYAAYFKNRKEKDIVDYWALYFRAIADKSYEQRNFDLAQVFANAPDKRFVITQKFRYENISIEQLLPMARTSDEKSALWLTYGIMTNGKALKNIEQVYRLTPASEELTVLLLREMNKIEDWILTPYYTSFGVPSKNRSFYYYSDYEGTFERRYKRFEEELSDDRAYASKLLKLLRECDPAKTADPLLWKTSIAYLQFISGDQKAALAQTEKILPEAKAGTFQHNFLEQLRVLCLVAGQPPGKAVIPGDAEQTLMDAYRNENSRFLFAVARELEYRGNTTDAAKLLSLTTQSSDEEVVWRTPQGFQSGYFDVFYDYFSYLDIAYTTGQLNDLITSTENTKSASPFEKWLHARILEDKELLYDLLGTKYMRKADYDLALATFKKIPSDFWDRGPYSVWMNANTFYTTHYNEHTPVAADTVSYHNKVRLLEKLLFHRARADDPEEPHRDYHYFLVANCELNMTFHGNSWMMKRYGWSNGEKYYDPGYEDDGNYYTCERAKTFYLKAKAAAKNRKFEALCIRMAGRCEKYRLMREHMRNEDYRSESDIDLEIDLQSENQYYRELDHYPDAGRDLFSKCESFDRYFEAYKQQ